MSTMGAIAGSRVCGACGRDFDAARENCLYCGWEPGNAEAVHGAIVRAESFRQGATLGPFALASVLFAPLGIALVQSGYVDGDGAWLGLGVASLLVGPGVLSLQLARRLRGAVETTQEGIVIGGELVLWSDIESVDLHAGLNGNPRSAGDLGKLFGAGSGGPLGVIGTVTGGRGLLGLLFLPILLLYFVIVPAIALLSPWHTRVVLQRTRGDRIVLHDVGQALTLANTARSKVEGPAAA